MNLRRLLLALSAVCMASLDGAGRAYSSVEYMGDSGGQLLLGMVSASPFGMLSAVTLVFAVRLLLPRPPNDRCHWVPSRYSEQFERLRARRR